MLKRREFFKFLFYLLIIILNKRYLKAKPQINLTKVLSSLKFDNFLLNFNHPEKPERIKYIINLLNKSKLSSLLEYFEEQRNNDVWIKEIHTKKHIDSLTQQSTYQHGNSSETVGPSTLDLNGAQGPEFQLPITDASQRHIDSLTQEIHSHNGGPGTNHYNAGPSTLDLNGVDNGNGVFDLGVNSALHTDSITNINKLTTNQR